MFSGRNNISHFSTDNVLIWMLMAFQAGALNVGGMMACHSYVSHTTGFASLLGIKFAETGDYLQVAALMAIPLCFLLGSFLSGLFVDLRIHADKRPWYHLSFGLMSLLIGVVLIGANNGYFGEFGEPLVLLRDYIFICILCMACGLQNGTVTSVSKSVIRTTHLTGITTDLGIGLARTVIGRMNNLSWPNEGKANLMRIGLILFFVLGSTAGAILYTHYQYRGFALPLVSSLVLFAMAAYAQTIKPRLKKNAG